METVNGTEGTWEALRALPGGGLAVVNPTTDELREFPKTTLDAMVRLWDSQTARREESRIRDFTMVACPHCRAKVGEICTATRGGRTPSHGVRRDLYRETFEA